MSPELAAQLGKEAETRKNQYRGGGYANGVRIYADTMAAMPTLRERTEKALYHAAGQARRAEALGELIDLLDKNPDVARILDLVEIVGR